MRSFENTRISYLQIICLSFACSINRRFATANGLVGLFLLWNAFKKEDTAGLYFGSQGEQPGEPHDQVCIALPVYLSVCRGAAGVLAG
jgi:hypothetical protein